MENRGVQWIAVRPDGGILKPTNLLIITYNKLN
jgi:hypothetical protein